MTISDKELVSLQLACANLYDEERAMLDIMVEVAQEVERIITETGTPPPIESAHADSPATEPANETKSTTEPAATANDKLCRFLEKRPECRFWTCVDLAKQIGEADSTVRKTAMWKVLKKERESIKKENKNKMALNSEYLSQAKRKKYENSG